MLSVGSSAVRGVAAVVLFLAIALPGTARADDTATCNAAYEDADALLKTGGQKLLEAREKLRTCARPSCKAWMVKECTTSLAQVEARIPSVVLVARGVDGREVIDVTVTANDGTEIARRLDGRAVETGPGERTFHFVAADGRGATVKAIVKEGEKAQRVAARLEASKPAPVVVAPPVPAPAPPPAAAPPTVVATPPSPTARTEAPPPSADTPSGGGSPLRTTGYVLAGVGAVGLFAGTFFGVKAILDKNDANCDPSGACEPSGLGSARSSATVSTISFIAGAALLAGGITLVIVAPSKISGAGRLEVVPAVAQREAGLWMRRSW